MSNKNEQTKTVAKNEGDAKIEKHNRKARRIARIAKQRRQEKAAEARKARKAARIAKQRRVVNSLGSIEVRVKIGTKVVLVQSRNVKPLELAEILKAGKVVSL
jgi:hypothetical protein